MASLSCSKLLASFMMIASLAKLGFCKFYKFKLESNQDPLMETLAVDQSLINSKIVCSAKCINFNDCNVIIYNNNTKSCSLAKEDSSSLISGTQNEFENDIEVLKLGLKVII